IGAAAQVVGGAETRNAQIIMLALGAIILGVLIYFIIGGDDARLKPSSMRILWQLLKGSFCSAILLIGCNMLFGKRGGIVLLHIGVAMLMISEVVVGLHGKENMLSLVEGQSSTFVRDIRERELAIAVRQEDGHDKMVVIPEAAIVDAARQTDAENQIIPLESLPFNVAVRKFVRNSQLRPLLPNDEIQTETGLGSFAAAVEIPAVTGMDDTNDESAVYVDVIDKKTSEVKSTILVAQNVSELRSVPIAEQVSFDGKDYRFYLRFQRNYRPYEVELLDVSRTDYVGSSTPRDYRSTIAILNPETGAKEEFTLWMNNPLRYQGETFYQSGYNKLEDGTEATTLSVVRNSGWMLPYIACMIVSFGMFAQFWHTLTRYLDRIERTPVKGAPGVDESDGSVKSDASSALASTSIDSKQESQDRSDAWRTWVPVVTVLLFAIWLSKDMRTPRDVQGAMNLYRFAELPIAWNGRAQPIDSFARIQLMLTSHKSTFKGEMEPGEIAEKREAILDAFRKGWPTADTSSLQDFNGRYEEWIEKMVDLTASGKDAIEERMRPLMIRRMEPVHWFLDVVARPDVARRHRVVRIDDDQVLSLLGLEKRAGLTYSMEEIGANLKSLESINQEAIMLQRQKKDHQMTQLHRRVSGLFETVSRIDSMSNMFLTRESGDLLTSLVDSWRILRILGDKPAVMSVPTGNDNEQRSWETMVGANALLGLSTQMKAAGIQTEEELLSYINDGLPGKIVTNALTGTYAILKSSVENQSSESKMTLQARAAQAMASMQDPFLQSILNTISQSKDGQTPEEMMSSLSSEQIRRLASERISSDLFEVFSTLNSANPNDPQLLSIRQRLQQVGAEDEDKLTAAMNEELAKLAFRDVQLRAGHLLPGGENEEVFSSNATYMTGILAAWRSGDVEKFNETVSEYHTTLNTKAIAHVNPRVVRVEAWFNFYAGFYKAICIYLPALVLTFFSWIVMGKTLRRTSFWLMALGFAVHTGALILRIWISGRPPVTNLYSSAIFIGWAAVLGSFFIERLLRNGIGNILGCCVGSATLVIAHYLAMDEGDTFGVMQAVLDTTFWLATHVVCITLGYSATFLAGAIGIAYVVMSCLPGAAARGEKLKSIGQLVYGVLCFALFFSLVGTVLGGLWADDSWGRFWGWDPKENGAMLIVLWNALILHARWDKLVRNYGTSVLAIVGNIVTAWSWFGVNELKAGLHTYGFTEGRLLALGMFFISQVVVIVFALSIGLAFRNDKSERAVTGNA
ncbi:MAG: cytochrome c biogenesis protein CcsA, partial [Planctomycetaceae bacterium]|nr:cytochrome c biogenesis protein CcsA [Planctomycetaceae bacterium]